MKKNKRNQLSFFTILMAVIGIGVLVFSVTQELDWVWIIAFVVVWVIIFFAGAKLIVTSKARPVSKVKEYGELLAALGGQENIIEVDYCATRVKLKVVSSQIIDEERIRKAGIQGIIKPSNTSVQLVTKELTQEIAKEIKVKKNEAN